MAREFHRSDRVGDAIQRELAELIRHEIRDPRIGMVSVNAVKVASDLSTAKVYVTFVEKSDKNPIEQRVAVLNKAAGFLRSRVGKEIQMRSVPRFYFLHDESIYNAENMSNLIDRALESDAKNHQKHDLEQKDKPAED